MYVNSGYSFSGYHTHLSDIAMTQNKNLRGVKRLLEDKKL